MGYSTLSAWMPLPKQKRPPCPKTPCPRQSLLQHIKKHKSSRNQGVEPSHAKILKATIAPCTRAKIIVITPMTFGGRRRFVSSVDYRRRYDYRRRRRSSYRR